jgi:hypothetical protein
MGTLNRYTRRYNIAKNLRTIQNMATSEVSQFNGNVHRHFIGIARSHTNHSKLRIRVVQVEKCELPKDFRGPPIGDRLLVRNFIEEGCSGAGCSLLNVIIKCVNLLSIASGEGHGQICVCSNVGSVHTGAGGAKGAWAGTSRTILAMS